MAWSVGVVPMWFNSNTNLWSREARPMFRPHKDETLPTEISDELTSKDQRCQHSSSTTFLMCTPYLEGQLSGAAENMYISKLRQGCTRRARYL